MSSGVALTQHKAPSWRRQQRQADTPGVNTGRTLQYPATVKENMRSQEGKPCLDRDHPPLIVGRWSLVKAKPWGRSIRSPGIDNTNTKQSVLYHINTHNDARSVVPSKSICLVVSQ
jgi:hypothetical protein